MKDTNKQIHDIIKYNPYREYFGPWSPKYIQDTFQETHKDPFRPLHSIHIGTLSVNTIFDTLWDEMSYNPVRFGETSPFEYDNCFGILHFCTKHKRANGDNDVMHNIAHELMEFSKNVNRVYREFYEIGELKDNYITIRCDANRRPNDEYKMLACLVHCVHLIASQNLQDYKTKQFRDKIQAVVIQRHPALIRSRRYHNFSALDRIATQSDKMYGSCFELCWSKNKHKRDIARVKWAGLFGIEKELFILCFISHIIRLVYGNERQSFLYAYSFFRNDLYFKINQLKE